MFSQDFSNDWEGYFSYLDIADISQSEEKIYAAADNAIFTYDMNTNEIEKISTINGLSGETISAIHYSSNNELLIIGYQNGLMEIVFDDDDDVLTIIDIFEKPTISPENKIINHFNEYNDVVYISTDYGISVYDLNNLEFGDTYFIGDLGTQIKVKGTTIFNEELYAVSSDAGVRKALVANPNLIDYQQWETISNITNWSGIESIENRLFAIRSNRRLYEIVDDSFSVFQIYDFPPVDIRNVNDKLIVTTEKEVFIYNNTLLQIFNATVNEEYDPIFTSCTVTPSEDVFIGTTGELVDGKPGYGLLKTSFTNPLEYDSIHPESPLLNEVFSIEVYANQVWVVYGGHSISYGLTGANRKTGISHFKDEQWINTPYDTIAATITRPWNLSDVSVNPFNLDQTFVTSFYSGLIETNLELPVTIYNQDNSTIIPFAGSFHITPFSKYDEDGALWVLNSRVTLALNKFDDGVWTDYDLSDVIDSPGASFGFSDIAFAQDGTMFIGSYAHGVIGTSISGGTINDIRSLYSEEQNMPNQYVTSIAMDNRNQLWIGTFKGLRVLYNTSNFFSAPSLSANEIVILEDDVPKELLSQQIISGIAVDGSNNKWIATIGAGLFYFSPDGQQTIFHFTSDNSPLPSNNIIDIAIEDSDGTLYIGTDKGLLSFNPGGSAPTDSLEEAYVFPNPVRPEFNIDQDKVKIRGIAKNVNIKITDIEGNLVAEAETRTNTRYKGYNLEIDGGTAFWNGKNLSNNIVASGVYLVMLSDLETLETKVLKVMVVR
ncbi:two-component regulator propeller domain-containing protein [Lacinutrix iliipiscaria]|uniref:Two-component regulator propeller domain-containing protein n=1 Tax=Lacinutrix iliipiscaria TaxID=1230532 RepID=A0ABW5WNB9_9FLAO